MTTTPTGFTAPPGTAVSVDLPSYAKAYFDESTDGGATWANRQTHWPQGSARTVTNLMNNEGSQYRFYVMYPNRNPADLVLNYVCRTAPVAPVRRGIPGPNGLFTGPKSFFTRDIRNAPLAVAGVSHAPNWQPNIHNSADIITELFRQARPLQSNGTRKACALNVWAYGTSFFSTLPGDPVIRVRFKDHRAPTRATPSWWSQIEYFPFPAGSAPTAGTDASLAVYDPTTDTLRDLWKFRPDPDNPGDYLASWGGIIPKVSESPGWYPRFGADWTGTTATSIAEGGAISIEDARAGVINHALTMAVPTVATWSRYSWPAQRSDGTPGSENPLMEGQAFRLKASVDVEALPTHWFGKMVCRALQTKGVYLNDRSSGVAEIRAENPGTATMREDGTNPWNEILPTPSYMVLDGIPWDQMEAVTRDWGKP